MYVFAIASIFYRCIIIIVGCYRSFYFFSISNSTRIIKEREKINLFLSLFIVCIKGWSYIEKQILAILVNNQ